MSSSTSLLTFQLNWKPSKYIVFLQFTNLVIALLCILFTSLLLTIKCLLALSAFVYVLVSLKQYWQSPQTSFSLQNQQLFVQEMNTEVHILKHFQWFDWGFMYVLKANDAGKNKQWFWFHTHLSDAEKRNLCLMIRLFLKKESHSIPSIITNPVL